MRGWRVFLVVAAVPLLALQATVGVLSHKAAERLVHPPRDLDPSTPAGEGLAYEPAALATEDGFRLAAWWVPAEAQRAPAIVFLHGYGASKAQSLAVASFLHRAGYHVLAFDFRGHGASDGTHTTLGLDEAQDVRAAVAYARAREDVTRVAILGWSMGAVAALHAAHDLDVDAMVLDSPFASLPGVASRAFTRSTGLPDFPFVKLGFVFAKWMTQRDVEGDEAVSSARETHLPLLIIHGLKDSLVGAEAGRILHEAAPRSELWLVPDADHIDAVHEERGEYEARVVTFLAATMDRPLASDEEKGL